MSDLNIVLPSKPRVVLEKDASGVYEIDNLYPGYGQTLGNSLRRIILSSLPGAAVTGVKIVGVEHEFSTLAGLQEDIITFLLNLKRVKFSMSVDEPQTLTLKVKGVKEITARDIEVPGQVEVLNPDLVLAHVTDKNATLDVTLTLEKGLGYLSKELRDKNRVEIGAISLDAFFSPVRRANYEVENMRVGDRTNFNRLRLFIETDGSVTPREVLEKSIMIMINQLKAIVGFKEEEPIMPMKEEAPVLSAVESDHDEGDTKDSAEVLKTRVESAGFSTRTEHALSNANIRTLGGLVRKRKDDLGEVEGLGPKGILEIETVLATFGLGLKQ
jgi:DNA-directed RNA polymerase subunit alpha